jgi:hypothetical protein
MRASLQSNFSMDWLHKFHRRQYWRDANDANAQIGETGPSESLRIQLFGQNVDSTPVLAAPVLQRNEKFRRVHHGSEDS